MRGDLVVRTCERHLLAVEQPPQQVRRFLEPRDAHRSRIEPEPDLGVLGRRVPRSQAELEPAVGQQVDGRGFAREQRRMPEVVVQHEGADVQPGRRLGHRRQRNHRRQQVVGDVVGLRGSCRSRGPRPVGPRPATRAATEPARPASRTGTVAGKRSLLVEPELHALVVAWKPSDS